MARIISTPTSTPPSSPPPATDGASSGPIARSPPLPSDKEVTVLVTGFSPFSSYLTNTSWSIASRLPTNLSSTPIHPTPIRILTPSSPIRVSYTSVLATLPQIYKQHPDVDIVLHIGMAGGRNYYTLETKARRDGYEMKDVDGRVLGDGDGEDDIRWRGRVKEWEECPEVLESEFDTEDVWRRWVSAVPDRRGGGTKLHGSIKFLGCVELGLCILSDTIRPVKTNTVYDLQGMDLRPSADAGRYLCEFTYYASLARYYQAQSDHQGDKPVMFLHVPADHSEQALQRGKDVAIGLTRALVESRRLGRRAKASSDLSV
ncbi:MAG: hypothetical protein M1827_007149 [Pycnora praestabilis]|nr:MAG: hypothetical protein M1827_007149 [Pycnora praestabilis]